MRLLPLPGVFKPHSDSLLLAQYLRREALPPDAEVLDLCTGSGALAITAAACGARRVVAVDISRRAVLAARLNAILNGVRVTAVRGDLFSAVPGQRFDLIVSNPPYVPSVDDQLPRRGPSRAWEAGSRGRAFLDRICERAADHLKPGGAMLLVHSSVCSEYATIDALSASGLQSAVIARQRGPLGHRLSERVGMLRARGLLPSADVEEIVIVRAAHAAVAEGAAA